MPINSVTELIVDREFDALAAKHRVNGMTTVLHCHHYLSLYTQLAEDCGFCDARALLRESSEDTFHQVLERYFRDNKISGLAQRIRIVEQYYAFAGLGKLMVQYAGLDGGEAALSISHVDEGWLKKFGPPAEPINYVTSGFVAAAFAAIFGLPARSFQVHEAESIATGQPNSRFVAIRK